jgi:hypothetical protein
LELRESGDIIGGRYIGGVNRFVECPFCAKLPLRISARRDCAPWPQSSFSQSVLGFGK